MTPQIEPVLGLPGRSSWPPTDRAVSVLRQHRNLLDADYHHDPVARVVTFRLCVRYGLTPHDIARIAEVALYQSLRAAGPHARPSHR